MVLVIVSHLIGYLAQCLISAIQVHYQSSCLVSSRPRAEAASLTVNLYTTFCQLLIAVHASYVIPVQSSTSVHAVLG